MKKLYLIGVIIILSFRTTAQTGTSPSNALLNASYNAYGQPILNPYGSYMQFPANSPTLPSYIEPAPEPEPSEEQESFLNTASESIESGQQLLELAEALQNVGNVLSLGNDFYTGAELGELPIATLEAYGFGTSAWSGLSIPIAEIMAVDATATVIPLLIPIALEGLTVGEKLGELYNLISTHTHFTTAPLNSIENAGPQGFRFCTIAIVFDDSRDPNLLNGPTGVGSPQFVSVNSVMPYTVECSNSDGATAPARQVRINYPITPKQDINSFRLNSIRINNSNFNISSTTGSYYKRLNLLDSIGVYVDVTAGLDVVNKQVFVLFQSLDSVTLQPPTNPLEGFLPPMDSTSSTDGTITINFTINPLSTDNTGDTTLNQAFIVFDENDTVPTNTVFNTIDAHPPVSNINPLPAVSSSNQVTLIVTAADDSAGSGVQDYDLYYSVDSGAFSIYQQGISSDTFVFTGIPGHLYSFYTLAYDSVGNEEAPKTVGSASTRIFQSNGPYFVQNLQPVTLLQDTTCNLTTLNTCASVVDPSGDSVSYQVVRTPLYGTVNLSPAAGSVCIGYQNTTVSSTSDSFYVSVCDPYYCDTLKVKVTVNPLPATPTAASNSPVLTGDTIKLTASTVTGATYNWTGPDSFSSTQQNPIILGATTAMSGTYQVIATSASGCNSSPATVSVTVVPTTSTISGVIQTEIGDAVPTVTVTASGSPVFTDTTGTNGAYDFGLTTGSTYTITPTKNNDSTVTNGVTTLDYLLIQRHILEIKLLSTPYEIIAADVNSSGTVTTLDLLLIQALILEKIKSFPGGKLWAFVPSDYVFPNPKNPFPFPSSLTYDSVSTQSNQNFVGIKLGDVNDSWNPGIRSAADSVQFIIPGVSTCNGANVWVPVTAHNFNKIAGFQFTMQWDSAYLQFTSIDSTRGAVQVNYGDTKINSGLLAIQWADLNATSINVPNDSALFYIGFKVTEPMGDSSIVSIGSAMAPVEVVDSDLNVMNYGINGGYVINTACTVTGITEAGGENTNLSVAPNPFTGHTNLLFNLPRNEQAIIQVYDALGQIVETRQAVYSAGKNQQEIGANLTTGVYTVSFKAGDYSQTIRIVSVEK